MRAKVSWLGLGVMVAVLGACGDSTGSGGSGAGGEGATGGAGATGGGGGTACEPQSCYEGPEGTEGIGECAAGEQLCAEDGSHGECMGAVVPRFENCATAGDEDCDGDAPACTGDVQWAVTTSSGFDASISESCLDVADGSVYILIEAYGPDVTLSDGTVVAVPERRTSVVAKIDPQGDVEWARALVSDEGGENSPYGCGSVPGGGVAVVGAYQNSIDLGEGSVSPGSGGFDGFVVVFEPAGDVSWSRALQTEGTELYDATVAESGQVVVGGFVQGSFEFAGEDVSDVEYAGVVLAFDAAGAPMWSETLPADINHLGIGPGGRIVASGPIYGTPNDSYIATIDSDGTLGLLKEITSEGFVAPPHVHFGPEGDLLVAFDAGTTFEFDGMPINEDGGNAAVLMRLDERLSAIATRVIDGSLMSPAITIDRAGNVLLAATYTNDFELDGLPLPSSTSPTGAVVKLDAELTAVWARAFLTPPMLGRSSAASVAVDDDANIYVSGSFSLSTTFERGLTLTDEGQGEGYVVRMAP